MAEESLDFNEEDEVNEGEELDEYDEQVEKERAKNPESHATPSELAGGPGGAGPNLHSGGPAEV